MSAWRGNVLVAVLWGLLVAGVLYVFLAVAG